MEHKFRFIVTIVNILLYFLHHCHAEERIELPEYWRELSKTELTKRLNFKPNSGRAKNIIFCLGDGMGQSTITAMRIYKGERDGRPGDMSNLFFENFPHVGLVKTYSTSATIADSSSTATAYMTGVKTKSFLINVDDSNQFKDCDNYDERTNLTPIAKLAKKAGKSVGVVSTSRLTDGSPASNYAQTVNRRWESDYNFENDGYYDKCPDVARQFVDRADHIDVMLAGGRREVLPNNESDPEHRNMTGRRLDGRNLITEWQNKRSQRGENWSYVYDQSGFDKINPQTIDSLLGLFSHNRMMYEYQRQSDVLGEPSLTEMTEKAIKILSKNKNGFYLFIEAANIDLAHHEGRAKVAVTEGLEFERAIQKAVDMTDPEETLVIVTGDHSHAMHIVGYSTRGKPLFGLSDEVGGDGLPFTTVLYSIGPGYRYSRTEGRENITEMDTESMEYRQQTAVPRHGVNHAGEDLSVYARGPQSHLIQRLTEQTYIHEVMMYAACLGHHHNQIHCHTTDSASTVTPSTVSTLITLIFSVYTTFVKDGH